MTRILLIEDDKTVHEAIVDVLTMNGDQVLSAYDGPGGAELMACGDCEVIVLDVDLPGRSGFELCRAYRAAGGALPILMLTGKSAVDDRITGLDAGADDYLPKPFDIRELCERIRALLRRPPGLLAEVVYAGDLEVDLARHTVSRGGAVLPLLDSEYAVLAYLLRHRGQIFSVQDLLNNVWNSESDSSEDAVRQCVARLRKKIDSAGEASLIVTVKGSGYKIN